MTLDEVMTELESLGSAQTKKTFLRHGAREPFFGVKVGDLKKIQKRIKHDHELALALFDTGNSDAMYLAGMIAEPARMKKSDLQRWVKLAYWYMISEYTVPWVASESPHGLALAREWIESKKEAIAGAGWATYGSLVSLTPDEELDLDEIVRLLERVEKTVHTAPNRLRYTMNNFVIVVGAFVATLLTKAKEVARAIGKVEVDMGDTDCRVPLALDYIEKVEQRGRQGVKRKTAFC